MAKVIGIDLGTTNSALAYAALSPAYRRMIDGLKVHFSMRNVLRHAHEGVEARDTPIGRLARRSRHDADFRERLGLVSKGALVKVLGRGTLTRAVTVEAHAFSQSARSAIESAGGSTSERDLPFKVRPAFHGSAHTNR